MKPNSAAANVGLVLTSIVSVASVPTGASVTDVPVIIAVSLAEENAVVPPFDVVSAVPPLEPLVWSQARKVNVAKPL